VVSPLSLINFSITQTEDAGHMLIHVGVVIDFDRQMAYPFPLFVLLQISFFIIFYYFV